MYLEEKVDEETWLRRLGEVRTEFNVLDADHAGEYPLTQACFADNMANCWTEEAFCAEGMDPTCAPKANSSDDDSFSTLTIVLIVVRREAKSKTSLRVGFFLDFRNFIFASLVPQRELKNIYR